MHNYHGHVDINVILLYCVLITRRIGSTSVHGLKYAWCYQEWTNWSRVEWGKMHLCRIIRSGR